MKRKILSLFIVGIMLLTMVFTPCKSVFASDDFFTLHVYLRDKNGKPLWNWEVFFTFYEKDEEASFLKKELTDIYGCASCGASVTRYDRYKVTFINPGVPPQQGESVYWQEIENYFYQGGDYNINVDMIMHGTTVIQVLDEEGNPVPEGVPLWITYAGPPSVYDPAWPWDAPSDEVTPHHLTDEFGRIELCLDSAYGYSGEYVLGGYDTAYPTGTRPGYTGSSHIDQSEIIDYRTGEDLTSELRYELWIDDEQHSYAVDVSSYAGNTRHVNYKVRSLGKIEAQAKDAETSEPIPDVYVDFDTESGFYKYWKRNDDYSGLSFYTYHDDTATITAKKPSDPLENYLGYQNAEATVTAVRWENTQVDLLMQKNSYGTVSGRILDSSGNGVAGATVELLWPDESQWEYFMADYYGDGYGSDYYTALKTVQTDEEGRYTFNDVIPTPEYETYAVRATKEDRTTGVSYGFSLASGEDVSVSDLTMGLAPDVPAWESGAGISAVSVGWGGVILEWPAAYVEDDYNYYVDGYRVYQEGNLAADISADDYEDAPAIRCRIGGLEPDTTYSFSVQAYSNTGNSSEILVMEEPVTTLPEYDPDAKVIRASMSSEGLEGTFVGKPQDENDMPESCWPTMSADGRFIAFESCADSLYDRDYNQTGDIFVFDRQTGILECISLSYDGETGNSYSFRADISADGRYVVFASNASNLVPGVYVNSENVYLYDRESKSMELVSDDDMDYISSAPRLSGDGRYVVYGGWASDDKSYIFIWDRDSKTTVRLDHPVVDEGDVEGPFNSVISNDGNYIAFDFCVVFYEGDAQVWDSYVYVYNQQTGTTELVSRRDDNPDEPASGFFPSISADGRYIAFESEDALVAGDVNNHYDIFVYDRIEGQMKLVSLSYDGSQGNGDSGCSAISANGRFVVFSSEASSLVPDDNNSDSDVFVRDLVRDTTERVSVSADGSEGDVPPDYSWFSIAAISDCGRYVAYESAFSLVPNDNNETLDIYIYDRGPQEDSITVPTAPQDFTATPGDGQVVLSWTAPENDGGSAISHYEVSSDNGATWVTASTGTSHTFTGLTNGIEYTFKVRAVNSVGYGEEVTVKATPIAPSVTKYTVTVTNGTGSGEYTEGATVTITANSAPDGQRFKQWQVISGGITLANPTEAITSFLMPANAVEVVATYEAIPTVPTAPQNFTATPGYGQVALSWTAPENNGSAAISHYEVSSDNGITWVMVSTGTSHTFTDLTNGTEYTFKVRAVNSAGQGEEAITTATPTSAPVPTYTVTVINGTGSGAYAQGVTVTISAYSAPDGQQFREWQVVSGDVELEDPKAPSTTFIMPANDVEITAVYEEIPVITYTVTVNGSYAATTGAGSYAQGDTVTINAGSRANYSFSGWTSPDGVTFANPNSATTTFIMPAKNVTVTANWTYTGHDDEEDEDEDDDEDIDEGDDEDGDDTGDSVPPTQESSLSPTYNANVKTKAGTETAVPVAVDKDKGTASVDIDPDKLPQGAVNITMPSIPDVDAYSVSIPVQDLSTAGAQDAFPFNTEAGSVTVPSNMLSGITVPEGDKAQITIGQGDKSGLPDGVREAIGDRPLIQLTLSIDGTQTDWNNPDVPVTVTIPYTPTAEELENPEGIVVWYIDGSGNVISVPNGRYDPATGTVTFTTTHFSYYAVSYRQVSFSDVPKDAWYAKAVSFIAARDITKGTGGGNFSPDAKLTRAQFIVMLMRAYGIVSDENPADNFADAGDTWYTGYLAAAKRLKISNGVGDNMFAPDREITRQEMFTLLYNTLKTAGQLPGLHGQAIGEADDQPTNYSGKTLTDFIDAGDIAPWARVAMKRLVEAGIISGSGNRLSPKDTASRAQMAQVLYNLLSK